MKQLPSAFKPAGILLILAAGLIHLAAAPDHYEEATYIGVLFSANLLGAPWQCSGSIAMSYGGGGWE